MFLILQKAVKDLKGSISGNWGVLHISTTSHNCSLTFGSLIHHAKEVADMFSTSVANRSEPGEKEVVFWPKISPILRLPQKAVKHTTQKLSLSKLSPSQ